MACYRNGYARDCANTGSLTPKARHACGHTSSHAGRWPVHRSGTPWRHASTSVQMGGRQRWKKYDIDNFLQNGGNLTNIIDSDSYQPISEISEFEFGEDSVVIKSPTASITYRYADTSILTAPQKEVTMPDADVNVDLSADDIAHIRRAGGALGHSVVSIVSKEGDDKVFLQVKDPNNSSANVFELEVGSAYSTTVDFDLQFLISNLTLIPGDYKVSVSSKLISHWECINNNSVEYWIALEKSSTFNDG